MHDVLQVNRICYDTICLLLRYRITDELHERIIITMGRLSNSSLVTKIDPILTPGTFPPAIIEAFGGTEEGDGKFSTLIKPTPQLLGSL